MTNDSGTAYIEDIPLDLIVPSKFNPRKNFDMRYVRELGKSLKKDGQWNPVILRKRKDGKFELIAGECRFRAAKLAGIKFLKARVLETNDEEALLLALKTNLFRQNLNPVEEAYALRELINRRKNLKDVTKVLNKSRTWILNRLKLAQNATEGLQGCVLRGELALTAAVKISELPEGLQGSVASKTIQERLTLKEVEKLVELLKKAESVEEINYLLRKPARTTIKLFSTKSSGHSNSQFTNRDITVVVCECGTNYIIDWKERKIVQKKVVKNDNR